MAKFHEHGILPPDTRANQPSSGIAEGAIYCVTDEDNILERWNGSSWDAFSPAGGGGGGGVGTFGFRFTLVQGRPEGAIVALITPSAWDTGADTFTLPAGHGLLTGMRCGLSANTNGGAVDTLYYLNVSSNTGSLHTSLADALAGSSKLNITGTAGTVYLRVTGIEKQSTAYLEPYISDRVSLWNSSSSKWEELNSNDAAIPITIPTLSTGEQVDLFLKITTGAIDFEWSTVWTNANTRADALVRKNGVWVKSGSPEKRYVATVKASASNTLIDDAGGIVSQVGGRRYTFNPFNRLFVPGRVICLAADYSINTSSYRHFNNNTGNKIEFLAGVPGLSYTSHLNTKTNHSGSGNTYNSYVTLNATEPEKLDIGPHMPYVSNGYYHNHLSQTHAGVVGLCSLNWLEWGQANTVYAAQSRFHAMGEV